MGLKLVLPTVWKTEWKTDEEHEDCIITQSPNALAWSSESDCDSSICDLFISSSSTDFVVLYSELQTEDKNQGQKDIPSAGKHCKVLVIARQ
jgi:hypothetical protein